MIQNSDTTSTRDPSSASEELTSVSELSTTRFFPAARASSVDLSGRDSPRRTDTLPETGTSELVSHHPILSSPQPFSDNKNIRESSHYQYKNFTQGERGSYFFIIAFSISMWLLVNQGLPWENNRIWMSGNPDNQAEIGTKPSTIMQIPVLGDILLFFVNGQFHRNDWGADQYRNS